ncbi:MAG: four helix bundle protein [bacterium]|nr:four helix bundle protein [bacterium]
MEKYLNIIFIAKMQIALKECAETEYWFEILKRTGYMETKYIALIEKNEELKRMLIAMLKTSKNSKNTIKENGER